LNPLNKKEIPMSDITAIADTLTQEFSKAVASAQKADAAELDRQIDQMKAARTTRLERLREVRRMREDAAKMIAESLRLEEEIEQDFSAAEAEQIDSLDRLRSEKLGQRKLRAVAGGKQG
jgi:hypothetical protein